MKISEEKTEKCMIIGIEGRLDTTNYTELEKKMAELLDDGHDRILVDCVNMEYISSSGLRILLMTLKRIMLTNGKFVLSGLEKNIYEIFEISGFTGIFEIHSTREEALKVF